MKIRVTQVRSTINRKENHKRIIKSLGLGSPGKSRIHEANPCIEGMIRKVSYLVTVEEVKGE